MGYVPAMVKVRCPACATDWELRYRVLGARMTCPGCDRREVPEVAIGTVFPDTGYELTFAELQQLLRQGASDMALGRRLGALLGSANPGQGDGTTAASGSDSLVDLLAIHERIQGDPDKQRELYGEAMAQWR